MCDHDVFAYSPGGPNPSFLAVFIQPDGRFRVIVRSAESEPGALMREAEIVIPLQQAAELAGALRGSTMIAALA